ncbi:alanine--glyoxylate aminotransferase family protein [Aerococcus sanguinicola]|uniref:Alanine--glyoxylate aminotransferase family protein n=1 Tax=Aerococcus sanguinicola TaxID=119206 RepID=A0A5N1GLS0_9LACT|nr:aminotransferase class V-fold PLP-dependent enzyme [Aerococcus sanguinicola]KAA9301943.1 alanine--glyoxylate aminotransferase family protein [Aerococcus sanguinicola]
MLNISPGPSHVSDKVLKAFAQSKTNTDLDHDYTKYQRQVEKKVSQVLQTDAPSFFMVGEALITLEAAIFSMVEAGDRVLILSNGVYGAGFADFVRFVGGQPVLFEQDWRHGLALDELESFLASDHDFQVATFVHCETPTGISNDIHGIGQLLHRYGILSIVDSVSGIGGEAIDFDRAQVDVLLGGSQKCLSAPVGIGTVTLSQNALDQLDQRESPIPSFYSNFKSYLSFDNDHFDFPYTMSENLVYAMDAALDQTLSYDFAAKHDKWAENTRKIFQEAGFELYAKDHPANTLTAVLLPEGFNSFDVMAEVKKEGILIVSGDGPLGERILRIAHMGSNMEVDYFDAMYQALDKAFQKLGIPSQISLAEAFRSSQLED